MCLDEESHSVDVSFSRILASKSPSWCSLLVCLFKEFMLYVLTSQEWHAYHFFVWTSLVWVHMPFQLPLTSGHHETRHFHFLLPWSVSCIYTWAKDPDPGGEGVVIRVLGSLSIKGAGVDWDMVETWVLRRVPSAFTEVEAAAASNTAKPLPASPISSLCNLIPSCILYPLKLTASTSPPWSFALYCPFQYPSNSLPNLFCLNIRKSTG